MSKYQVIIERDDSIPNYTGTLYTNGKSIEFDPTTILAKLNYRNEQADINDYFFDDFDYAYEYGFGVKLKINNREQYYKLIWTVRRLIQENLNEHKQFDMSDIEKLRLYFDISSTFTASKKSLINMGDVYDTIDKHESELSNNLDVKTPADNNVWKSINLPKVKLDFHYYSYSPKNALDADLSTFSTYFYDCNNLADVVFSILHFQTICELKYQKCIHCGTIFATTSRKNKFCKQNSPYPGYTHLECEQAVRNILQKADRKKHAIDNNFLQNHDELKDSHYNFRVGYTDRRKKIKNNPTPDNFNTLFDWINSNNWYE